MTEHLGARELLERILDPGTWVSWDTEPVQPAHISSSYRRELAEAATRSGTDEALITGQGSIGGHRVAVVLSEFRFLAGSVGQAASKRLVAAIERATNSGLPLLAAPSSGGTRMQEGTPAFMGMVRIATAVARHKTAGLPYIVYLRHPTTGGVFASWGSLGHFTAAEPGALIGFIGPRVFRSLFDEEFPKGVQAAENLLRHGLIDAVLAVDELAATVAAALDILMAPRQLPQLPELPKDTLIATPAWESIIRSRRPDRPGVRTLLDIEAAPVVSLSGTGAGESDASVIIALAKFGSASCVLLGQDRHYQAEVRRLRPAGLRQARRGMRLARELRLPLVSMIDTPGVELSPDSEEGAVAGEIARCLSDLVQLEAPSVCVLLGEGSGGGALALLPADTVISAEHSWLSPLSPEGASELLYRDTSKAPEVAGRQRVRSIDLLQMHVVDRIVTERPDAADDPESFCRRLSHVLQYEMAKLAAAPNQDRVLRRLEKLRALGDSRGQPVDATSR